MEALNSIGVFYLKAPTLLGAQFLPVYFTTELKPQWKLRAAFPYLRQKYYKNSGWKGYLTIYFATQVQVIQKYKIAVQLPLFSNVK